MRKLIGTSLIAACALAVPLLATSPAHASLDACGDIHVEADAQCALEVEGGCEVHCEPVNFYAACSAEGYVKCDGECNLPSVECDASCEGECAGKCEGNPEFSCEADCQGTCETDCSGSCAAAEDKAECEAHCKATCQGECSASCSGSPVECEGKCKGSCEGSCTAQTNMSCQVDCQSEFSGECYAEMEGGCKAACKSPEGALFCNGQYVDHGGNLKDCINALKAAMEITVDVSASAKMSAECDNGVCVVSGEAGAEAEAGCGMSVANGQTDGSTPYALGLLGALGAMIFGRYRRRQR